MASRLPRGICSTACTPSAAGRQAGTRRSEVDAVEASRPAGGTATAAERTWRHRHQQGVLVDAAHVDAAGCRSCCCRPGGPHGRSHGSPEVLLLLLLMKTRRCSSGCRRARLQRGGAAIGQAGKRKRVQLVLACGVEQVRATRPAAPQLHKRAAHRLVSISACRNGTRSGSGNTTQRQGPPLTAKLVASAASWRAPQYSWPCALRPKAAGPASPAPGAAAIWGQLQGKPAAPGSVFSVPPVVYSSRLPSCCCNSTPLLSMHEQQASSGGTPLLTAATSEALPAAPSTASSTSSSLLLLPMPATSSRCRSSTHAAACTAPLPVAAAASSAGESSRNSCGTNLGCPGLRMEGRALRPHWA